MAALARMAANRATWRLRLRMRAQDRAAMKGAPGGRSTNCGSNPQPAKTDDPNRSFKKWRPRQAISPGGSFSASRTPGGAAMDVGGWLRRLGLEQYEAAFRENKIDDTVLPSLTAEDLKDLGVGFVGHRRKLLDAIVALRAEASTSTPVSDGSPATENAAKDTAELRQ